MNFTFEETPASRAQARQGPSFTLIFKSVGEVDDLEVANFAKGYVPLSFVTAFGTLFRQDIQIQPDGWNQYTVTVPYGRLKRDTGSWSFSFDSTGGTAKITAAKEHIADYGVPSDPLGNDTDLFKSSIGVTKEGVEGCDIVFPAMKLSYGYRHPQGIVNSALARQLARNTGRTNSDSWDGYDPGELLFMGATGSDGSEAEAEVNYHVLASENATGMSIGEIVSIAKKGHEYLWVYFRLADSGTTPSYPVRIPQRVFIERVYDSISFSSLFGWAP